MSPSLTRLFRGSFLRNDSAEPLTPSFLALAKSEGFGIFNTMESFCTLWIDYSL